MELSLILLAFVLGIVLIKFKQHSDKKVIVKAVDELLKQNKER